MSVWRSAPPSRRASAPPGARKTRQTHLAQGGFRENGVLVGAIISPLSAPERGHSFKRPRSSREWSSPLFGVTPAVLAARLPGASLRNERCVAERRAAARRDINGSLEQAFEFVDQYIQVLTVSVLLHGDIFRSFNRGAAMALEGTLRDMSLSDLFQVFRMGPKTGTLRLACADLRAIVYIAAGELIDAAMVRLPDRRVIAAHDEAVIQMLLWDDAMFVFRHDPSVLHRPVRICHDAEHLVLESIKRRDDLRSMLPYHHITPDTCLQLSPLTSGRESSVSLSMQQWRILSQVPHHSSVRAISKATGMPSDQVIRLVLELMAIGMVEIAPAPRPVKQPFHRYEMAVTETENQAPHLAWAASMHANGQVGVHERRLPVRRSLIDAVMRRVRGL